MGFFDLDRWNEIWETINRNRRRSIMTAFGVFWGIFMLAILAGAGGGLEQFFRSMFGDMAVNSCFYFGGRTSVPYDGFRSGRYWSFENKDIEEIKKQLPDARYVAGTVWGDSYKFSRFDKVVEGQVMGHTPEYYKINPRSLSYGRYINDIDMEQRRKVCVIGPQVYKELFKPGEDPVGQTIRMGNLYLTVVGVIIPQQSGVNFSDEETTVIIPFTTIQQVYNMGAKFHGLAVTAADNVPMDEFEEQLKAVIRGLHHISPEDTKAIHGFNLGEQMSMFTKLFTGISFLTWFVGALTLLAGVVGISNIMLVVVRERTQEIGVRRALGAKPSNIISQIMTESFILTFVAGIGGLALAVLCLSGLDTILANAGGGGHGEGMWSGFSAQVSFWSAMGALLILILGGLFAGVIPAMRAIRIKPVDAIREE